MENCTFKEDLLISSHLGMHISFFLCCLPSGSCEFSSLHQLSVHPEAIEVIESRKSVVAVLVQMLANAESY